MGDSRAHRVNRSHLKKPHASSMITLHGNERNKLFLSDMWAECHSIGSRRVASSLPPATCAMGLIALFSDPETVEEGCVELMKLSERNRCDLFEHFKAFVICPWWSRIWVVQEIAAGTVITIQYGPITLHWETLVETANVWSLPKTRKVAESAGIEPENLRVFSRFANQVTGLEQTRRRWHAEGGTDLVRLLQEFSDRQATDDRDKVYGLLSLAKQNQKFIKPDYQLEVFETYRATALALIGKGGSLACWTGDQKRKFNRGLPSWIPDWSTAVENGDKRRMDLFESYRANCGWTLRIVESEIQYWNAVEDEMELVLNSPAGKSGRLPASLNSLVLDYIDILTQRARSMYPHSVDADELYQSGMERLSWNLDQGYTAQSTLKSLKWCMSHNVTPRYGVRLLKRWIRDVEKSQNEIRLERGSETREDVLTQRQIRRKLLELSVVVEHDNQGMETRMFAARRAVCEIQSIIFVSKSGAPSLGKCVFHRSSFTDIN